MVLIILLSLFQQFCISDNLNNAIKKSIISGHSNYKIQIINFDILYYINDDSSMNITENITIIYQGTNNTGFKRLIPFKNDFLIRNVKVNQIVGNETEKVYYKIYYDKYNLILDIGDNQNKYGKIESYSINYEFKILNKIVEQNNMIKINVIGINWKCIIEHATVKLIVPSKFTNAQCFICRATNKKEYNDFIVNTTKNNRKIISASFNLLDKYQGVSFNLQFQPESIKRYFDKNSFQYIINSCVILIIIIVLSLFINKKNKINPICYKEGFKTLDPLIMSKLLNGYVDKSDITSNIFYWASKGFIDISIENEDNPILIKKIDSLPASYPSYQIYMFDKLFKNKTEVYLLTLYSYFYKIVDQVIKLVDEETKNRVDSYSVILSLILATIGSIWIFVAPMRISNMISQKEFFDNYYIFIIYIIFNYLFWALRYDMTFKYKPNNDYVNLWFIIIVFSFCLCCLYVAFIPNFIINYIYKIFLFIPCFSCTICSVLLVIKSDYFKEKINQTYGIYDFIKKPIDNEFQSLLENDPELFYNFICYAQVLGLSNIWKNKFIQNQSADLPKYIKCTSADDDYYNNYNSIFYLLNRLKTSLFVNLIAEPKRYFNRNNVKYDHDDYGDYYDHDDYGDNDNGDYNFSGDGYGGGGGYGD